MRWDDITLTILAVFGCVTLLLAQLGDVLGRLPPVIRAWRQVRRELNGEAPPGRPEPPPDDDRDSLLPPR
ncbi:hypothetical protein ABZ896_46250 [Streptomyces sp. NPDC047072]|uniref:hypothetical protein n=1 Tax=Streptomyces sp. NPDC047072 TaxID=3154809 RepID=UPI0033D9506E